MKIGLVRRGFSPTGGAEAYLLRLARGLATAGHEPFLITSGRWPKERWPDQQRLITLPSRGPIEFAQVFRAAAVPVDITFSLDRAPGCDVYRAGDGVHAAWLRRRSKFEPFWKTWFHRYNPKHIALMHLEREVFRSARAVIANSRMVAEEISHWHDYPEARVHVIPNGIGSGLPPMDRTIARKKLGVPEEAFCVLFVGTGWERKGLRFAIRAVEKLGENALLLVAGRGSASRHASPSAKFLGPVSDLSALFAAADVFTLPTIYDPFSNACLEALAAGLPVVTTAANGCSEILTPGVTGSVVEPGDAESLAQALASWKGRSAEAAPACRALAAEYSIERNVEETLKVLAPLLSR